MQEIKETVIEENNNAVEPEKETTALEVPTQSASGVTMWNDDNVYESVQRRAMMMTKSTIVPQSYRNNVADCIIAIDVANQMKASPIFVMQNSQVVQGNFSWKGTACKAMIDSCGRYVSTKYVEVGTKGQDDWGFYLEAIDRNGNIIKGVPVTMKMAKDEGWYGKSGSKWKTMPELMMKYRCSAFFMRTECAGIAMGFLTVEENEDIYGSRNTPKLDPQKDLSKLDAILDDDKEE